MITQGYSLSPEIYSNYDYGFPSSYLFHAGYHIR